jgi:trimeric autotransporter adhesin
MKQVQAVVGSMLILLCSLICQSSLSQAQQVVATDTNAVVPPLVNFSGALADENGKPLTGAVAVTFSLYPEQTGGTALWMETQNVLPDRTGHYTVMLGSTSSTGLPADIFVAGEAHWLGVQVDEEAEQPRVLLVSAPYALKAGDAQTLGGLPASAFVQASPATKAAVAKSGVAESEVAAAGANSAQSKAVTEATVTGAGKTSYIPFWTSATNLGNSLLFQTGDQVGINTITPTATLDVKGSGIFASSSGSEALEVTQTGSGSGVVASTNAAEGYGVTGTASSTTSSGIGGVGVYGVSLNPLGYGVLGVNSGVGVYGYNQNLASTGIGVQGQGNQYGVYGFTAANPVATTQAGVYGSTGSASATAYGVEGNATATTGTPVGVFGNSSSSSGYGVYGASPNVGLFGNSSGASGYGVYGNSPNVGLFGNGTGTGGIGVDGHGVFIGVKGVATAAGGLSGYFGGGPVEVAGNGNNAFFGDPGCGSGFSGFGLTTNSLSGCNNYTLIGKNSGDVYLNSTSTGSIHFRNRNTGGNSNSDLATIDNAGDLTVAGKVHSGNAVASVTLSNVVGASVGDCATPIVPNPNCLTPGMSVTVTTSGGPVLIMADIGGISTNTGGDDACQTALFYIVMDKQIVSQHPLLLPNGDYAYGNLTMMSLQTPAAGTHTFQVQETDDASSCGSGDYSPTIVSLNPDIVSYGSTTRTLIVREL